MTTMAQVKRDFPKGAVVSWQHLVFGHRIGTVVGYDTAECGLASEPEKFHRVKVQSGKVIHYLDPDSLFPEA